MDPVSHVAFGRTLVALDTRCRLGPGAIAACVVGSLAPDLDAMFMPLGWDIYLRRHQGGTHSLIGSVVCAALTAAVVRLASKRGRSLGLLLAAWAGAAGHLVLDVISGADVRVFWPVGQPVTLPLFAMADPWLGGLLVLGLVALALSSEAHVGRLAILPPSGGSAPDSRELGSGRRNVCRTATVILLAAAGLAAGKAALYARAQARGTTSDGSVEFSRADVDWGSLTRWITYETRSDTVDARRVNGLTGTVTPLMHVPRDLDHPLVVRSRELETVRNFLVAHDVTFATVIGASPERLKVLWSDLRYCGPLQDRAAPWAPIALGRASHVSCALWFGGEFDPVAGLPEAAIVYVGHLEQRRPVR